MTADQTGRRKTVFVVEDDEEQLAILRILLNSSGYDVVTESNGDRVIAGVRNVRPDIILLDVMIPSSQGLDGFQLCQELRTDPVFQKTPIIIVSAIAQGMGEMRKKVQSQVGADDFITKPYSPDHLLDRIRELTSR